MGEGRRRGRQAKAGHTGIGKEGKNFRMQTEEESQTRMEEKETQSEERTREEGRRKPGREERREGGKQKQVTLE